LVIFYAAKKFGQDRRLAATLKAGGAVCGVSGAWIGTSEFADAAGFGAAQAYGNLAGAVKGIPGTGPSNF
jgi:hypothetical protein